MRAIALAFLTIAATFAGSTGAAFAERVIAHPAVVVDGEAVTLGDIFEPAGDAPETILFRAPQPGKRLVLRPHEIEHFAKSHDLEWTPQFGDETVIVERRSVALGGDVIARGVAAALQDAGYGDDIEIELTGRVPTVHMASGEAIEIGVEDLRIDARTRRFAALIVAPAGDPRAERVRVAGRMLHSTLVPVPVRTIAADEIITDGDLSIERRRDVRDGIVTNPEQVVGMVARRTLRAGHPIRSRDIDAPMLVTKGRAVTMVYRSPGLLLTAIGTAIEDGASGQTVRVINAQSKSVVRAIVSGPDAVVVPRSGVIGMN